MTRSCCLLVAALLLVASAATAQEPAYGSPGFDQEEPQQQAPQGPQPGYEGQPPQGDEGGMQYGYFGPHPQPVETGQAPCGIEGPHFHPYPPFDRYLFRESNGYFYFIGDLGDFNYQGQMWGYQGNHPLPVEYGGGFCYIDWPHRHPFPPPASMQFNFVGGYYAYAGVWDPSYYVYRARWNAYFGGYYRNNYYGGRYFTVRPRPIYGGSYSWGARGVYRAGQTVYAPGGVRVTVGRYNAGVSGYNRGYAGHPVYVEHPGYARPSYSVRPGNTYAPAERYNGGNRAAPVQAQHYSAPQVSHSSGGGGFQHHH